jgi:hypothetical protein
VYRQHDRGRVATIECALSQPLYHERLTPSIVRVEYDTDGVVQAIRQA